MFPILLLIKPSSLKFTGAPAVCAAPDAGGAQRARPGVQGELPAAGRGGQLDRADGEEALVRGEEHAHFRALRDQDPGPQPAGVGARAQGGDRLLWRGR